MPGRPPGTAHRTDADGHGNGTVSEPRLYHLIGQHGHLADRSFEITFLDPGIQAYAFTFRLDHGALPCHPCRFVPVRQVNADLLDVRYVEPGAADGQLVILHGFPKRRRALASAITAPPRPEIAGKLPLAGISEGFSGLAWEITLSLRR